MTNSESLSFFHAARSQGELQDLEYHFAELMIRLVPEAGVSALAAGVLTVRAARDGHVCLPLTRWGGKYFPEGDSAIARMKLPETSVWKEEILASGIAGQAGDFKPLIFDKGERLYLQRYHAAELRVAEELICRADREYDIQPEALPMLEALFGSTSPHDPDWQRVAAAVALARGLTIISGGPGTGKTHTVVKLLALLIHNSKSRLRLGLAAPTGKAAARLQESIAGAVEKLAVSEAVRDRLPKSAATLHRLLGYRHGDGAFRHHRDNPLPLDVLVVDEASMVDLLMMNRLLAALPKECRLILLGDRDQLASVEAGSILADLCAGKPANGFSEAFAARLAAAAGIPEERLKAPYEQKGGLSGNLVLLEKSYRFASGGVIGRLAAAVRIGAASSVFALLSENKEIGLHSFTPDSEALSVIDELIAEVAFFCHSVSEAESPEQALVRFLNCRVLCAHREGQWGAGSVNARIEQLLAGRPMPPGESASRHGRPVLVTANDYGLGLYNGDIGITWRDKAGDLRVHFSMPDGRLRSFPPSRLPSHETAWAMSVHKSQGSEFDRVLLLLPDKPSPVVTRELLYTAVTRAKSSFTLWAPKAVVEHAVNTRTYRHSGLADRL